MRFASQVSQAYAALKSTPLYGLGLTTPDNEGNLIRGTSIISYVPTFTNGQLHSSLLVLHIRRRPGLNSTCWRDLRRSLELRRRSRYSTSSLSPHQHVHKAMGRSTVHAPTNPRHHAHRTNMQQSRCPIRLPRHGKRTQHIPTRPKLHLPPSTIRHQTSRHHGSNALH